MISKEQIKQARLTAGLTQASLAKEMNVTISTVSRWERGELNLSGAARKLFEIVVIKGEHKLKED